MSASAIAGQERRESRRFGPDHRTVLGIGVAAQAGFSAAISGLPVTGTSMRADYLLTAFTLGVVIGAIGIALLPGLAAEQGFRVISLFLVALCFITAVATFIWLHEPDRTAASGDAATAADVRSPLVRWDIWRLALASALLTVLQIGGGAARIWSGRYTDKRGNRRQAIKVFGAAAAVMLVLSAFLVDAPTVLVAAGPSGAQGGTGHRGSLTPVKQEQRMSAADDCPQQTCTVGVHGYTNGSRRSEST
jgi:hypothetical protein